MPFWAVSHYEKTAQEETSSEPNTPAALDDDFFSGGSPFTAPSAYLWRSGQLRPAMLNATRSLTPGGKVNATELVRTVSHGRLPRRLPRNTIKANRPGLWVVLDHRQSASLFRQDINRVKEMIATLLGEPGEHYQLVSVTSETAWGYFLPMRQDGIAEWEQCPAEGQMVLVSPAKGAEQAQWHPLINAAKQKNIQLYWINPAEPKPTKSNLSKANSTRHATQLGFTERAAQGPRFDTAGISAQNYLLACISQC